MRARPCVLLLLGSAVFVQCSADAAPAGAATGAGATVASAPGPSATDPGATAPAAVSTAESTAQAPATPTASLPTPLVFDREARLAFPARASDPVFNFLASGTLDVMFCPSALPEQPDEDGDGALQCLLACSDGEEQTRYALYLLENLDGFGFWNGTDLTRIEYPLDADVWVHIALVFHRGWLTLAVDGMPMAVVRASIGRPIDPNDRTGRKLAFCAMHLGSAANGSDAFLGRIAWLRSWRAPLAVDDLTRLPVTFGPPADPVLAQCLGGCTDFAGEAPQLVTATVEVRAQTAELARAAKGDAPFVTKNPWSGDLDEAKARAAEQKKLILAWATRGDAYDGDVLAVERGPLAAAQLGELADRCVPLLLLGDTKDRTPAGVPVGQGAILDATGKVLRRFEHWDTEFVGGLLARIAGLEGTTGAERQARELLLQPSASLTASDLQALAKLERGGPLSADVTQSLQQARLVAQMLALQERFRRGEPLAPEGGAPVPFADADWLYASEALRLFDAADLPLEPQSALADYAVLLVQGVVENPRDDLVLEAADFVVPMRVLDAVVDAAVVVNPLPDPAPPASEPMPGDGR